MKLLLLLGLSMAALQAPAQILKNIGDGIKRDTEWKIERKARTTAGQGIDSVANKTKNIFKKKNKQKSTDKPAPDEKATEKTTGVGSEKQEAPEQGEGYITLALSTPVTTKGLSVEFSGESIRHDKWKTIQLEIKGPDEKESKTITMTDSGLYRVKYDCLQEGDYLITAHSSNALYKLLHSLQTARKEAAKLASTGKLPPQNAREHLSHLNRTLTERNAAIKDVVRTAKHNPSDNTVCEYIVLLPNHKAATSSK